MFKGLLFLVLVMGITSPTLLAEPIINVEQPIKRWEMTSEQMKSIITLAAEKQGWVVTPLKENQLSASYHYSNYMAQISIHYTPDFYTIDYADSTRMRYKGNSIHPTYNRLIKALQANIVHNIKTGGFKMKTVVLQDTNSTTKDTIRMKLTNIKKLYEEGLITEKEYDTKRKVLIESY